MKFYSDVGKNIELGEGILNVSYNGESDETELMVFAENDTYNQVQISHVTKDGEILNPGMVDVGRSLLGPNEATVIRIRVKGKKIEGIGIHHLKLNSTEG